MRGGGGWGIGRETRHEVNTDMEFGTDFTRTHLFGKNCNYKDNVNKSFICKEENILLLCHPNISLHTFLPMFLYFCFIGPTYMTKKSSASLDQHIRKKRDKNRTKKRIYDNQCVYKALIYPIDVTNNIRAYMTNSMSE